MRHAGGRHGGADRMEFVEQGSAHLEDKALIHEVQKGNKELLNTVIEKYYPDIYRFCAYLTGNREDAYDLAQETFLKFIQYVDSYRYRNLKAYLLMIARNSCMDYFRRQKKEAASGLEEEMAVDHDREIAQVELQSWLFAELQKLPEFQREAIIMYYYDELKLKDIAKITGVSLSTVKSRIRQATEKLKGALGPQGETGF